MDKDYIKKKKRTKGSKIKEGRTEAKKKKEKQYSKESNSRI